jgi:large subunit ribosomal protein L7/L12
MGWIFWIVVIGVFVVAVTNTIGNQNTNNKALGVTGGHTYRTIGLNYLGGHPAHPQPIKSCTFLVTASDVVVEKGAGMPVRLPMSKVTGINVETEAEARQRYTATRMLAFGVFALAVPKKTAGSVLVAVETDEGPLLFEKEKSGKAAVLKALGPSIAAVNRAVAKRPVSAGEAPAAAVAPASVADELTKLMTLRDGGALSPEEFEAQKALVLAGQASHGQADDSPVQALDGDVDVVLTEVGDKPISVIKVVRSLTDLGLREAKDLVDSAPVTVMHAVPAADGGRALDALELAGASCELVSG